LPLSKTGTSMGAIVLVKQVQVLWRYKHLGFFIMLLTLSKNQANPFNIGFDGLKTKNLNQRFLSKSRTRQHYSLTPMPCHSPSQLLSLFVSMRKH
jgi:hypothetical protein